LTHTICTLTCIRSSFSFVTKLVKPLDMAQPTYGSCESYKYIGDFRAGICCIVPPPGWAPPFALEKGTNGMSAESFRFLIRRQLTSHLCMRLPNTSRRRKAAASGRSVSFIPSARIMRIKEAGHVIEVGTMSEHVAADSSRHVSSPQKLLASSCSSIILYSENCFPIFMVHLKRSCAVDIICCCFKQVWSR